MLTAGWNSRQYLSQTLSKKKILVTIAYKYVNNAKFTVATTMLPAYEKCGKIMSCAQLIKQQEASKTSEANQMKSSFSLQPRHGAT